MAIAFIDSVASASLGASGGSTGAIDTTGAKLLVMAVGRYTGGSLSDSAGNSWTTLHSTTQTNVTLDWAYVINPITSATHTFTYSGANTYPSIAAAAYSSGASGVAFDSKSVGQQTATSVTPGTLTPGQDNSIVISATVHELGETVGVTESLTIRENNIWISSIQDGCALGDLIQTTAAASNPSWSSASSGPRVAGQVVFYDTTPAATPGLLPLVIVDGVIQQIQSPELLSADALPTVSSTAVEATSGFGTDNVLLRADGTSRLAQETTAVMSDRGQITLPFTIGSSNMAIGSTTLDAITSGVNNTAIGDGAMTLLTVGSNNFAVGTLALTAMDTGTSNTALGSLTLDALTTGSFNTGIGSLVLSQLTGASYNTSIGYSSLNGDLTGGRNTAMGYQAALQATLENNTCIGFRAGYGLTGAQRNTFIGSDAGVSGSQLAACSNSIVIGYNIHCTASNTTVIGNSSNTDTFLYGDVILQGTGFIGTGGVTSPAAMFDGQGTSGSTEFRLTRVSADTGSPRIRFRKARGTPGSEAVAAVGDILGTFTFHAHDGTQYQGADSPASAMFFCEVTGTISGTTPTVSIPADIVFNTTDSGASANSNSVRISHENGLFVYTRAGGTPTILPTNAAGFFASGANAQMSTIDEDGTVWPLAGEGVVVSPTTTYTVVDNTAVVLADATSAAFTVTLPAATAGAKVHVKKIDASGNAVTVDGAGADTIDGSLTAVITTQYTCLTFVSDGTEWWII